MVPVVNSVRKTDGTVVLPNLRLIAGLEVLTAVVTNSSAFWDMTPCSPNKPSKKPAYFSVLKMEAKYYYETLVGVIFQRVELFFLLKTRNGT
jgi:hypothetical protein